MSQILYIDSLVDWSLSGIMTSKLIIHEYEKPQPAASSILISRMTSSLVIIPYIMIDLLTLQVYLWLAQESRVSYMNTENQNLGTMPTSRPSWKQFNRFNTQRRISLFFI